MIVFLGASFREYDAFGVFLLFLDMPTENEDTLHTSQLDFFGSLIYF